MPAISIPAQVLNIINLLEQRSYKAHIAGKCVYDLIIGEIPQDFDIITNADFSRLLTIFENYDVVSKDSERGEIIIQVKGAAVLIAPYRYGFDSSKAVFAKSITEDLARREFSFLAMAFNPNTGYVDPFGGGICIHKSVGNDPDSSPYTEIHVIGEDTLGMSEKERLAAKLPIHAFSRTPYSILTALIYAAKGSFVISDLTRKAIFEYAPYIEENFSADKGYLIYAFTELLTGRKAGAILLEYAEIIAKIIPEISFIIGFELRTPHHEYDLLTHTSKCLSYASPDKVVRWALFLHEVGKSDCFAICGRAPAEVTYYGGEERSKIYASRIFERLGADAIFSKYDIDEIYDLIKTSGSRESFSHIEIPPAGNFNSAIRRSDFRAAVKRLFKEFSREELRRRLQFCYANMRALADNYDSYAMFYKKILEECDDIATSGECYSISTLAVKAVDLIQRGLADTNEAAEIILNWLLDMVMITPALNNRTRLLQIAEKAIRSENAARGIQDTFLHKKNKENKENKEKSKSDNS